MFAEENPVMVASSYILSMNKSSVCLGNIFPPLPVFLLSPLQPHCSLFCWCVWDTRWSRMSKEASREMRSGK